MSRRSFLFSILLLCGGNLSAQKISFTVAEKDLIPEGITADEGENFYISSVFKNKVIKVSKKGVEDFISSNAFGFMGGVGLHVDSKRKILWACSGDIMGKKFRRGVFAFDLSNGKLMKKVIHPFDTLQQFFNDLVIARDGSVYITDTFDHSIWRFDLSMDKPVKVALKGTLEYPNGIEISPDNRFLICATDKGLKRIELSNGTIELIGMPDGTIPSYGLDGIGWYKNSVIGVQNYLIKNKSETKVVRYYLTDDLKSVTKTEVIDRGNKYFDVPTTLTIVGNTLFVLANSQLDNLDQENHKILDTAKLAKTIVLKYNLK